MRFDRHDEIYHLRHTWFFRFFFVDGVGGEGGGGGGGAAFRKSKFEKPKIKTKTKTETKAGEPARGARSAPA